MGPDCYKAQSTVSDLLDVCEFACMALWSRHKEKYLQCHSPTECFNQDFATASKVSDAWEQGFDLALAQELSSSCSFEFEQYVTRNDTATGSQWNTKAACGDGAVELVQVLFSDEFVLKGKLTETPSCAIQDITDLMRDFCENQTSSTSAACDVSIGAFEDAEASSLCPAALNPSMLVRFNCDIGKIHSVLSFFCYV
ncbi:hypothetical protein ENH_00074680 [Eimeria necatrix]|uniref:Uncharacterized protein n=1 Tax=Eimeria necatrix TaxID=51315 RepID=U6MKS9_9EIME|nr:hypothetical protein ENH_00074680 [Eimeria necatrix]CDJ64606.1 hypothetical protein ENH_00074680 [Eimeria necatrix]